MRDLPVHSAQILAGLWGADNYLNISITETMRTEMFSLVPEARYGYDQKILADKVWPVARFLLITYCFYPHFYLIKRNLSYIHDSFRCLPQHREKYGYVHPFPTQKTDGCWTGSGPRRLEILQRMKKVKCPPECRPEQHLDWISC